LAKANRLLEIGDGPFHIAPQAFQAGLTAVSIQILLELDHPLIGVRGFRIVPNFQIGIA
jgi:hypothetical protein